MEKTPLMLSVSGLRGLIGKSLTPDVSARYAATFGAWLKEFSGNPNPHVAIGRDSRPSGQMIEDAAVAGLIATGCKVMRLGIVSTPAVAVMAKHIKADGGMVITASHNPIIWNGIKLLSHDGIALSANHVQQIIDSFKTGKINYAPVDQLMPTESDNSAAQVHVDSVLKHIDVDLIRSRNFKAVVDSVHGAGGPETALMMETLGIQLVHLYAQPTGQFPHTPEPTINNLTGLCDEVKKHNANVGFAQDPDADRLAIVDENGKYIGEEYTLALAAMHVLKTSPGTTAANLSTSRMIDDVAKQYNCVVRRSPVGEANVAQAMKESQAIIGGEGNGGLIWPVVSYVRDSLVGIGLILELMAKTSKSISKLTSCIPVYAIVKEKIPIEKSMEKHAIEKLSKKFTDQKIDLQDGIRIDFESKWVHVRTSNTEPIMRLIAEAADIDQAQSLISETRKIIESD